MTMPTITIYETSTIYVNESVVIHGVVKDENNNVLEGEVLIRIDGHDSITVTPDDYEAGRSVQFTESGIYNASATYVLFGEEIIISDNITITVNRIPTNTTVRIINNTYGNVLIDVVVVENATGYHDSIRSGTVNVTINGQTVQYPIKGSNTTINITGKITTTGRIELSVVYNGSEKYVNSTGMNYSDTDSVFDHIDVVAKSSNMTVIVNPVSVGINQTVDISGQVFDEYGNVIETGVVYITVDGQYPQEVEIIDGTYTLTGNRNTTHNGTITVTVNYPGQRDGEDNLIISPSVNTTTFNVQKLPTITTVEVLNSTAGNVTIDVTVVVDNSTHNPIRTGVLNISIAGGDYVEYPFDLTTTDDNNITIKLSDITSVGDVSVKVVYTGSEVFVESEGVDSEGNIFKNIKVVNQTALLTVTANDTEFVNTTTVNITGNLTDDMGNNLTGERVDIYINNKFIGFAIVNSTGGYSYIYTTDTTGEMIVNATYAGDNKRYSNASDSTKFNVIKLNTTVELNVSDINYTQHELVNITVNESSAQGSIIVEVNKTSDNSNVFNQTYTFSGSIIQVDLSDLATGEYNVTVTYLGDSIYNGNNTSKTFTVNRLAEYELNVTAVNITYGEEETITVNLPNDAKGTVTVNITGRDSVTILCFPLRLHFPD